MKEEKRFRWADGSELMVSGFYKSFSTEAGNFRKDGSQHRNCVVLGPLSNAWKDLDCRRGVLQRMFGFKNQRLFVCEYEGVRHKENENEKEDSPAIAIEELVFIVIVLLATLSTIISVP
ncbi:hypothetical protein PoB_001975000 [Plakobranchus ocellatus]|uniref:C-type lectin domain-containing protein n=1 Tax=Plakobranchus ocellatus TaxID=259542 RepID=A0AAV3ZCD2_9GAST|nr:hypothetical protein PoB_001975000 [Plakobranchus ocellatus]